MAEQVSVHTEANHTGEHSSHHVIPTSVYYRVFAALMVLLVLTLIAAAFDLGEWNLWIAVTIAVAKATLIVLYFMHMRFSSRLVQVFGIAALFWLGILFVLTLSDYLTRRGAMLPSG